MQTVGKHKQEVVILPNSHNYSDKKRCKRDAAKVTGPQSYCLPHPVFQFSEGGGVKKKETSKNPRLNKVLAGEAYTYPKLARYRETHSSLKFHLKILQYSYYCFGFMCC